MPGPDQIDAFLRGGVAVLLATGLIALVLEIVVPGRAYRRVLAERDAAFDRLERILDIVEAATGVDIGGKK